ncbi:uncharacterized protein LOC107366494 [Tetranychus urticae]|uniref:ZP domain-containing protein n=1 Tax=Tetranychus urticae TaxID=32264 RepID=T1JTD1_TETUR|nr:uncharacterized protein LOC107366494 [Tetranychus urticae]
MFFNFNFPFFIIISSLIHHGYTEEDSTTWEPTINARCERGMMIINVLTLDPFYGVIHTEDFRKKDSCRVFGIGSTNTTLRISAVASEEDDNFCGVQRHKSIDEDRAVTIAVRIHRDLELSVDRYYSIACSQTFSTNSRTPSRSRVTLKLVNEAGSDTSRRLIHGNRYKLQVDITNPDPSYGLYIRNCVAFSSVNSTEIDLINQNGCPIDESIISPFDYTNSTSTVEATIKSMFKFPGTNRVFIQCAVLLCKGGCNFNIDCEDTFTKRSSISKIRPDSNVMQILASTTVFVVDPGEDILDYIRYNEECTVSRFPWLVTLCTVLGILLLIMLIVNIFLCTTLTCTCTKTEVVEKEDASELEDYDPYKIDWAANNNMPVHGSTYGSRSSLAKHLNDGNESDFRPNSRYSSQPSVKRVPAQTYANY